MKMSCFKGCSMKSCFPVDSIRRGGSKMWRGISGVNTASYSLNHESLKGVMKQPKCKEGEPKKHLVEQQLQLEELTIDNQKEDRIIPNSEANREPEEADTITSGHEKESEERCQDIESEQSSGSGTKEHPVENFETTDVSDDSHYITCGESTFGHSFAKLEELINDYDSSYYESLTSGSRDVIVEVHMDVDQEGCTKTSGIETQENTSSEGNSRTEEETDIKYLVNSVLAAEEQKIANMKKYQRNKTQQINEQINRESRDYDLIEYSSINFEDLMTRVYDSVSDIPHETISEEQRKNMVDIFKSSFGRIAKSTDVNIATPEINENEPTGPINE